MYSHQDGNNSHLSLPTNWKQICSTLRPKPKQPARRRGTRKHRQRLPWPRRIFRTSHHKALKDGKLHPAFVFPSLLNTHRLTPTGLPQLLQDIQANFTTLAQDPKGATDPFESIYLLVYQLTMRIVGCDEIANDPSLLKTTLSLFETVESSATATAVLFPWFPSPAIIKRTIAGTRLYLIFKSVIEKRIASGKRGEDPLQYLLDQGDSVASITEVCLFSQLMFSHRSS